MAVCLIQALLLTGLPVESIQASDITLSFVKQKTPISDGLGHEFLPLLRSARQLGRLYNDLKQSGAFSGDGLTPAITQKAQRFLPKSLAGAHLSVKEHTLVVEVSGHTALIDQTPGPRAIGLGDGVYLRVEGEGQVTRSSPTQERAAALVDVELIRSQGDGIGSPSHVVTTRLPSAPIEVYRSDGSILKRLYAPTKRIYSDLDDFLDPDKQRALRLDIERRKDALSVSLVIPTIDSSSYILRDIGRMLEQIKQVREVYPSWHFELIVAINGQNQTETINQAMQAQSQSLDHGIDLTVLHVEDLKSKVVAMNAAASYVKENHADIIGFIDDDNRYGDRSLLRVLSALVETPDMFLTGPQPWPEGWPEKPSGLWARAEYELRLEPAPVPYGPGLFLFTDTYAPIPENILADDAYLGFYMIRKEGHPHSHQRVQVVSDAKVFVGLADNSIQGLKRFYRWLTGYYQVRQLFDGKSMVAQGHESLSRKNQIKQRMSEESVIFEKLRTGRDLVILHYSLKMLAILLNFKTRLWNHFGRDPFDIKWYAVPPVVSLDQDHVRKKGRPSVGDGVADLDSLLQDLEAQFEPSSDRLRVLAREVQDELGQGLRDEESQFAMDDTYVRLPSGQEEGHYLAIDWGGSRLRIYDVELKGLAEPESIRVVDDWKWTKLQKEAGLLPAMDFVAERLDGWMTEHGVSGKPYSVGLGLGFRLEMSSINSGRVRRLTKGWLDPNRSVLDERDVVELFNARLAQRDLGQVKITALTNDTVGMLIAYLYQLARENPDVQPIRRPVIGLAVGTGFNLSAYLDGQIYDLQAGHFVPPGNIWNRYDEDLNDHDPDIKEEQGPTLRKMISGRYLGEIVRLVISGLSQQIDRFQWEDSAYFSIPYRLDSELLSIIALDQTDRLTQIKALLETMGVDNSVLEERRALQRIVSLVVRRSARLVGGVLAGVLQHFDLNQEKIQYIIPVEGSVYSKFPGYPDIVLDGMNEVLGERVNYVRLEPGVYLPGGMAIEAAVTTRILKSSVVAGDGVIDPTDNLPEHIKKGFQDIAYKLAMLMLEIIPDDQPLRVFIDGLPASGKTTMLKYLIEQLRLQGRSSIEEPVLLDHFAYTVDRRRIFEQEILDALAREDISDLENYFDIAYKRTELKAFLNELGAFFSTIGSPLDEIEYVIQGSTYGIGAGAGQPVPLSFRRGSEVFFDMAQSIGLAQWLHGQSPILIRLISDPEVTKRRFLNRTMRRYQVTFDNELVQRRNKVHGVKMMHWAEYASRTKSLVHIEIDLSAEDPADWTVELLRNPYTDLHNEPERDGSAKDPEKDEFSVGDGVEISRSMSLDAYVGLGNMAPHSDQAVVVEEDGVYLTLAQESEEAVDLLASTLTFAYRKDELDELTERGLRPHQNAVAIELLGKHETGHTRWNQTKGVVEVAWTGWHAEGEALDVVDLNLLKTSVDELELGFTADLFMETGWDRSRVVPASGSFVKVLTRMIRESAAHSSNFIATFPRKQQEALARLLGGFA